MPDIRIERERPGRIRRVPIAEEPAERGFIVRAAEWVLEYPIRTGSLAVALFAAGAIAANALFFQTGKHPSPFFAAKSTQTDSKSAQADKAAAAPPIPRSRSDALAPLIVRTERLPVPRPDQQGLGEDPALVAALQRGLATANVYDGPADGVLGTRTRNAIRAYQQRFNLAVSGEPSQALLDHMRATPAAAAPTPAGPTKAPAPARLRAVQAALNRIGYGPVRLDGQADEDTSNAIRRFELDNGLPVTGSAGDPLVKRLVQIGAMPQP